MTKIEWTDKVWNPITGCTKVSEGCENCYAMRMAKRLAGRYGYSQTNPFAVSFHAGKILRPLKWKKTRRIFVCSMGDLFHEDVGDGRIMDMWRIMGLGYWHKYMILTKRPEEMKRWLKMWSDTQEDDYEFKNARGPEAVRAAHKSGRAQLFAAMLDTWGKPPAGAAWPTYDWAEGMIYWPRVLPNLWLGVSAENQKRLDERVPTLLDVQAAMRFVSLEPLLGPIYLNQYIDKLDWVIVGCESGPGRRDCNMQWIEHIVWQCDDAQVPIFVKQAIIDGKLVKMPKIFGKVWDQYPEGD